MAFIKWFQPSSTKTTRQTSASKRGCAKKSKAQKEDEEEDEEEEEEEEDEEEEEEESEEEEEPQPKKSKLAAPAQPRGKGTIEKKGQPTKQANSTEVFFATILISPLC